MSAVETRGSGASIPAGGVSPERAPGPITELRGVSFAYDGIPALKDVSFALESGGFAGVVGPNGSGKSTLLKIVDGILACGEGDALLEGRPVDSYSRRELARAVAFVPQSFNLDFEFTAREVIEMGRYARKGLGGTQRVVEDLLDRLDIRPLANRPFPELSGGEKQMVVLAQALAQEPRLMLLDEPAAHLDVSYQLKLFDLLKSLNGEGLATLCVLHDLNLAMLYFDELLMLSGGRLVAHGVTGDVLTPETIEAIYGVRAYVHRHAGRTFLTFSPRSMGATRGRVHLICGGGTGAYLMRELVDLGFSVSAGVVNALDTDEVTGRELGLAMAAEAPFTDITDEAHEENLALARGADLVILTDVPIGTGNARNLEAFAEAARAGKSVWAVAGVEERDFCGAAGGALSALEGIRSFHDSRDILKELVRWER